MAGAGGVKMRGVWRTASGPMARIVRSDDDVAKRSSMSRISLQRTSIRQHSACLSVDLNDMQWQQKIMQAWPKKCTFVVREILQSEQAYRFSLEEIVLGYVLPLHGFLLTHREGPQFIHTVFNNIIKLQQLHEEFLYNLQSCCGEPPEFVSVFIDADFDQYKEYCTKFSEATEFLQKTLRENEKLRAFIQDCQMDLEHSLPLHSHLIKPVQRILKYHLMLDELLKEYDKQDDTCPIIEKSSTCCKKNAVLSTLVQAYKKMKRVSEDINDAFNKKQEETSISPALIAKKRSKEIKYLERGRRQREQRALTESTKTNTAALQRSLEFEDSISLLHSTRSSSYSSRGREELRPSTMGLSKKRRPRIMNYNVFELFKETKSTQASCAESSASASSESHTPPDTPSERRQLSIDILKRSSLLLDSTSDSYDENEDEPETISGSPTAGKTTTSQEESPSHQPVTVKESSSLFRRFSHKKQAATLTADSPGLQKESILPNKPKLFNTQPREKPVPKKSPLPWRKGKRESSSKKESSASPKSPKSPFFSRKVLSSEEPNVHKSPLFPRKKPQGQITKGKTRTLLPLIKQKAMDGEQNKNGSENGIPTKCKPPVIPPKLGQPATRLEKPQPPKKPTTNLLPNKPTIPMKRQLPVASLQPLRNDFPQPAGTVSAPSSPTFPDTFIFPSPVSNGLTLPFHLSPASPQAKTFFPSMLKPLKSYGVRDSILNRHETLLSELKQSRRITPKIPPTQNGHLEDQTNKTSTVNEESEEKTKKVALLPPSSPDYKDHTHKDSPPKNESPPHNFMLQRYLEASQKHQSTMLLQNSN